MLETSQALVCPVCRGQLASNRELLLCGACGREYKVRGQVADLTPIPPPDDAVLARWALWEQLQRNGELAYAADPSSSLSVDDREEPRLFGAFCDLAGDVLDVGCGPQALPSYASDFDGELVGIDPLEGEQPRRFRFVKGIAEYLPFPSSSFDRVLFATSLDHMLSPELAIGEAARVVRPDGAVLVWLGETPVPRTLADRLREAGRLARAGDLRGIGARLAAMTRRDTSPHHAAPSASQELQVPEGAVDPFHVAHPDPPTVRAWLEASGLAVTDMQRPVPGSCFLRAAPVGQRRLA